MLISIMHVSNMHVSNMRVGTNMHVGQLCMHNEVMENCSSCT